VSGCVKAGDFYLWVIDHFINGSFYSEVSPKYKTIEEAYAWGRARAFPGPV
jgi:hypothetical protein